MRYGCDQTRLRQKLPSGNLERSSACRKRTMLPPKALMVLKEDFPLAEAVLHALHTREDVQGGGLGGYSQTLFVLRSKR